MKLFLLFTMLVCAGVSTIKAAGPALEEQTNFIYFSNSTNKVQDASQVAVPEPSEKAMSFYRSGNVLWVVRTAWSLLLPALILFTGFSARLRSWAAQRGHKWYFAFALYFIAFTLLSFLLNLPLNFYSGFARLHSYDLSNQIF